MKFLTRDYLLPDGRSSSWDLLDGGSTVAVLALTTDHRVVLAPIPPRAGRGAG
jgi:ADP-ribose pyrophosphatase